MSAGLVFPPKQNDGPIHAGRPLRVIIAGGGASGLLMAYKLQRNFDNLEFVIYEKNPDIGGTWYENRYPGCACDNPAHTYVWVRSFRHNVSHDAKWHQNLVFRPKPCVDFDVCHFQRHSYILQRVSVQIFAWRPNSYISQSSLCYLVRRERPLGCDGRRHGHQAYNTRFMPSFHQRRWHP